MSLSAVELGTGPGDVPTTEDPVSSDEDIEVDVEVSWTTDAFVPRLSDGG